MKEYNRLIAVLSLIVILLPSCTGRRQQVTVESRVSPTRAAASISTQRPTQFTEGTASGYPGPEEEAEQQSPTAEAYPAPSSQGTISGVLGGSSYPAPGEQGMVPSQGAYPGPGAEGQPSGGVSGEAYPAPATSPPSVPTVEPTTQPTVQSTPRPSPLPLDTGLNATDPDEFQLVSGKVQLVEFFAFWCGICRAMAPTIHDLETRYDQRVNFIYLDIDDPANDLYKDLLHYREQPQFLLLDKDGNVIREWQGNISEKELADYMDEALRK